MLNEFDRGLKVNIKTIKRKYVFILFPLLFII